MAGRMDPQITRMDFYLLPVGKQNLPPIFSPRFETDLLTDEGLADNRCVRPI